MGLINIIEPLSTFLQAALSLNLGNNIYIFGNAENQSQSCRVRCVNACSLLCSSPTSKCYKDNLQLRTVLALKPFDLSYIWGTAEQ